ncbi:DEAD/DEAH box helicase [Flexithrix dorotheae]|uniref:DEAD/DEAH box helicase n=1 Tax=Flexithrix dorotheae TaxID=70993 RepID=UPI0003776958|nr:DEAD/DEAH box helicase [Flexithrix dorotheae]
MSSFASLNLSKFLLNAISDLGFETPTPIQEEAYPIILSGKDIVGISQTGTGKTFAYALPLLRDLKFSRQVHPRILILVPTRELVLQVVDQIKSLTTYMSVRVLGVYGGVNINTQRQVVAEGSDILVATPGRLYDLVLSQAVQLKAAKKLVIDEVDVMLDLGFRFQLTNIFELMPEKRQNIMFSATMTEEVDELIDSFFTPPTKISIAVSGTPLENITQQAYPVKNFNTKVNLLAHLLKDKALFHKVLVFVSSKKLADRLFEKLEEQFASAMCIIHSNKSQNYRERSVEEFDEGKKRILIATDVIARGLDLDKISHVINFDVPSYPENYMHRIGRTGRAEESGNTIMFYTEMEEPQKEAIEALMDYEIPLLDFPDEVEINNELIPEERPKKGGGNKNIQIKIEESNPAFHEKKEKNKKVNVRRSHKKEMQLKYKKPKKRAPKKSGKGKR